MSPLPPSPSPSALPSKLKRRFFLFAVIVIACTIALASLLISAVTPSAKQTAGRIASGGSGYARDLGMAVETVGTAAGISNDAAYGEEANSRQKMAAGTPSAAPAPAAPAADAASNSATEQRIIKNGSLSLRVADAPGALEQAKAIVEGKGGYVESSSLSDSGNGPRTAYATVRVPVAAFTSAISDLKQLASTVLDESTNANDVTMQYVDLESNLRNARAEEQSYLELLKRTGSMNDVLSVTRALADVRGRIERLDGQKRYMESQTDDATIRLTLTEETRVTVPTRTWKPLEVVRDAFHELVLALQGLVDVLIRLAIGFVGLFIPIALIVALFIWLGWKVVAGIIKRFIKP
jgi:hypothetical protein